MGTATNCLRIGVGVLLLAGLPAYGFFGGILGGIGKAIGDAIEGAAKGQATKLEQLTQIKNQVAQIDHLKSQVEHAIRHGKKYQGTNAWKAGLEIRKLKDMSLGLTNRGKAIANESYASTGQLQTMLRKAEQLSPSLTAEEQVAFNRAEDVAARKAVRDSLASTMRITSSIYQQLDDVEQRFHAVTEDLSQADSQLEALQLIGASNQQTNTYLHTLTQALVAQTDMLANIYARELAEDDRRTGDSTDLPPKRVIVPAHKVAELRAKGIHVKPVPEAIQDLINR